MHEYLLVNVLTHELFGSFLSSGEIPLSFTSRFKCSRAKKHARGPALLLPLCWTAGKHTPRKSYFPYLTTACFQLSLWEEHGVSQDGIWSCRSRNWHDYFNMHCLMCRYYSWPIQYFFNSCWATSSYYWTYCIVSVFWDISWAVFLLKNLFVVGLGPFGPQYCHQYQWLGHSCVCSIYYSASQRHVVK